MHLSKDLVPIISKKDMDKEATKFLQKYCPEALDVERHFDIGSNSKLKFL